jgi:hypothetical protein
MAKITTIRAKVVRISTDRTQYAPYKYDLEPENLYVELIVPEGNIVHKDKEVVVELEGFSLLLGSIADSIDSMHKEHEYKQTGMRR